MFQQMDSREKTGGKKKKARHVLGGKKLRATESGNYRIGVTSREIPRTDTGLSHVKVINSRSVRPIWFFDMFRFLSHRASI